MQRSDDIIREIGDAGARLEIAESPISTLRVQTPTIAGDVAFKLYDTFGLPVEITKDEARERGVGVDEAGFAEAREAARERNRGGEQFAADYDLRRAYGEALETLKANGILPLSGVDHNRMGLLLWWKRPTVAANIALWRVTEYAVPDERLEIVLPYTTFYVESGGQVSDTGVIVSQATDGDRPAWRAIVRDTRRPAPGLILHVCDIEYGQPAIGDACIAQVDKARRQDIMRNHTATHLLQKSLRSIVGTHVGQQGSLVAPDRLRFDYSHSAPLSQEQIDRVSEMLNDAILENYPSHREAGSLQGRDRIRRYGVFQ